MDVSPRVVIVRRVKTRNSAHKNPGHLGISDKRRRPDRDTPLAAWCRATGTSTYKLARQVKADPAAVANWARGRNLPSLGYAIILEMATNGGVPIKSWAGTELFKLWMNNCRFDWDNWYAALSAGVKRRSAK